MWQIRKAKGIWAVLALGVWACLILGGWPRFLAAAAFFVFLGSCIPIAVLRALEDSARKATPRGLAIVLVCACNVGKIATILGLVWLVTRVLNAYGWP